MDEHDRRGTRHTAIYPMGLHHRVRADEPGALGLSVSIVSFRYPRPVLFGGSHTPPPWLRSGQQLGQNSGSASQSSWWPRRVARKRHIGRCPRGVRQARHDGSIDRDIAAVGSPRWVTPLPCHDRGASGGGAAAETSNVTRNHPAAQSTAGPGYRGGAGVRLACAPAASTASRPARWCHHDWSADACSPTG